MSRSKYRKGAKAEWELKRHLEANGLYVVRSAGSHGLFDLVAIGPKEVLLIQVKKGKGRERPPVEFREKVRGLKGMKRVRVIWAHKGDFGWVMRDV